MKFLPSTFPVIFSLLLLTFSCDNSTSGNSEDKIVGEWIWQQSIGGWSGSTINPETVGYSIRLVFEEDGSYKEYRNDSLAVLSSYTIKRKEYGSNTEKLDILVIENYRVEQLLQFENSNRLKLLENCLDCYEHTYLKHRFF